VPATRIAAQLMESGAVGRAHPDSALSHVEVVSGIVGANVKAVNVEESTATVQARAASSATTFAALTHTTIRLHRSSILGAASICGIY